MPEDRIDIPCEGGTVIAEKDGDGIVIKFVTPDGRIWDSKKIALEDRRLIVK